MHTTAICNNIYICRTVLFAVLTFFDLCRRVIALGKSFPRGTPAMKNKHETKNQNKTKNGREKHALVCFAAKRGMSPTQTVVSYSRTRKLPTNTRKAAYAQQGDDERGGGRGVLCNVNTHSPRTHVEPALRTAPGPKQPTSKREDGAESVLTYCMPYL